MRDVAEACRNLGGEAFCASVDVTNANAVQELADEVVRRFGRIDVWINNAGVGVIGSFTDVPVEEHRRVIETNVLGYIYGAHAALKVFKRQGFGVLINNASISSRLAAPHIGSYTASKFAIRGLTHSLRQDLAVEGQNKIHVCQINPAVIDTPAFQHAGNYSGLPLKIKIPKATPEHVARKIFELSENPRREIFVGPFAVLGSMAYTLLPALTGTVLVWLMKNYYFGEEEKLPGTPGNLFDPIRDGSKIKGSSLNI